MRGLDIWRCLSVCLNPLVSRRSSSTELPNRTPSFYPPTPRHRNIFFAHPRDILRFQVTRKAKPQPGAAQWNQRAKLIQEFARLDQEVADFKPKLFRHGKLRELILDWYPAASPEEEITVPGINCDIVISARDLIRSVTPQGRQKLYRLWGSREFVARASVLLKSLPDPKDEAGLYTVQAPTGPRHLRVAGKAAAAKSAA